MTSLETPQMMPDAHASVNISSPDLGGHKSLSSISKNSRSKKNVHWHPSVIDNEYKRKWIPQETALTEHHSSPDNSPIRLLERLPQVNATSKKTQRAMPVAQKSRTQIIPSFGSGEFLDHGSTERTRALAHLANSGRKRNGMHRPASRSSVKRPQSEQSRAPPAVPDPPASRQQPPQTPKISRLPTPDLPDFNGEIFCLCAPACSGNSAASKMTAQRKRSCLSSQIMSN
jgi:hypothetical protein